VEAMAQPIKMSRLLKAASPSPDFGFSAILESRPLADDCHNQSKSVKEFSFHRAGKMQEQTA
jgi:hypothetical protein